jgi:uncharacterized membrane protein YfcA
MTLQLKNVLTVLVTAAVGIFSGWFISAKYANERFWWIWLVLDLLFLAAQVLLAIVKTREENLYELQNDLVIEKTRGKVREAKAIGVAIEKEIAAGNPKKAKDWKEIRDKL